MITGSQCKAARALIEINRDRLSRASGLPVERIELFERQIDKPSDADIHALQQALETFGAVFLADNGGGIGVRLKFTASESKRLSMLENEGGLTAYDEVP